VHICYNAGTNFKSQILQTYKEVTMIPFPIPLPEYLMGLWKLHVFLSYTSALVGSVLGFLLLLRYTPDLVRKSVSFGAKYYAGLKLDTAFTLLSLAIFGGFFGLWLWLFLIAWVLLVKGWDVFRHLRSRLRVRRSG
jgi:hypothetical protein